jgi:hypothetical protein
VIIAGRPLSGLACCWHRAKPLWPFSLLLVAAAPQSDENRPVIELAPSAACERLSAGSPQLAAAPDSRPKHSAMGKMACWHSLNHD